jgi:hypothetical protein
MIILYIYIIGYIASVITLYCIDYYYAEPGEYVMFNDVLFYLSFSFLSWIAVIATFFTLVDLNNPKLWRYRK